MQKFAQKRTIPGVCLADFLAAVSVLKRFFIPSAVIFIRRILKLFQDSVLCAYSFCSFLHQRMVLSLFNQVTLLPLPITTCFQLCVYISILWLHYLSIFLSIRVFCSNTADFGFLSSFATDRLCGLHYHLLTVHWFPISFLLLQFLALAQSCSLVSYSNLLCSLLALLL